MKSTCQYPGIGAYYSASYVNSHGIQPGRAIITVPVDKSAPLIIEPFGDLVLGDGQNSITIPSMRLAGIRFASEGGKTTAIITLEDHRWLFYRTGQLNLRVNIPAEYKRTVPLVDNSLTPQGNQNYTQVMTPPGEEPIRPETALNAPDIARECMKAMGVGNYDVSALDPNSYPYMEYDSQNPAFALQELVERYGCHVIYRHDNDSLIVCKEGVGLPLPDGPMLMDSSSIQLQPLPQKVIVRSAPTKYQLRFKLEAVGLDFDGAWKALPYLSYAPNPRDLVYGGFDKFATPPPVTFSAPLTATSINGFPLPGKRLVQDANALARKFVYSAYRVMLTRADGKGPLKIPPDAPNFNSPPENIIRFQKQILLTLNQVEVTRDDINRHSPAPAQVFGRHSVILGVGPRRDQDEYYNTRAETELLVPIASLDVEHAIIIFAQPVYAIKEIKNNGQPNTGIATIVEAKAAKMVRERRCYPAELILQTACYVCDNDTWQIRRQEYSANVPGGVQPRPHVIIHEELQYGEGADYLNTGDANQAKVNTATKSWIIDLSDRANYYLQGEILKLVPNAAQTRIYCGINPNVFPDGAIQQVSYEVGGGTESSPCTTASLNTEHDVVLPTYAGRRMMEEADLRRLPQRKPQLGALANDLLRENQRGGRLP